MTGHARVLGRSLAGRRVRKEGEREGALLRGGSGGAGHQRGGPTFCVFGSSTGSFLVELRQCPKTLDSSTCAFALVWSDLVEPQRAGHRRLGISGIAAGTRRPQEATQADPGVNAFWI